MTIAPIRRTVTVKAAPARAFAAFTRDIGKWWPGGMAIGANPFVAIEIEPRDGGRWYERDAVGAETEWGKVLTWDPPGRVVLAWQIDASFKYDPNVLTEVELTFTAQDDGTTLVAFEHRNLERLGDSAAAVAEQMRNGWAGIIDGFADYASSTATEETAQ
jgi:uncharacterized protein YndB with AHSA1/START domain